MTDDGLNLKKSLHANSTIPKMGRNRTGPPCSVGQTDGRSNGCSVFTSVCLCVCLSDFPHDISIIDVARITKLDVGMFHDES